MTVALQAPPTASSVLVSSSKYLNSARLRHWTGRQFLHMGRVSPRVATCQTACS